jgi:peptidoglycan/xylan/chitin deacetylase (PgdA/CDA1 family)
MIRRRAPLPVAFSIAVALGACAASNSGSGSGDGDSSSSASGGRGGAGSSGSGGSNASGGAKGGSNASGGGKGGSGGSNTGGGNGGDDPGTGGGSGSAAGTGGGKGSASGGSDGSATGGGNGNASGGNSDGGASTGGSSGGSQVGNAVYPYEKCNWGPPVFTKLPVATAPPGGLAIENVPQLISFGFDDNAHEDGMQWFLDFIKSKVNPAGSGNPCTFDGTAARVSFFDNSHVDMHTDAMAALHARAFREGHETGNHTDTHADTLQQNPDKAVWTKEMVTCNDYLVGLGIPRDRIVGFRTPFLQQSEATFQAIVEQKFRYDCSIEHYYGTAGFVWPYTLDTGKAPMNTYQGFPRGSYPGLWEMPVSEFMIATTGYTSVTGLDFNMWISKRMSRKEVVDTLKANLEIRMKGGNAPANRAPFFIGAHTDLYSNNNADANAAAAASVADRRAAIEEFITYALAYHPAVRLVPHAEILHWMQSPVGLDGAKGK